MNHTFAIETSRDTIRVWGPDATRFLQGQLSQDVGSLAVGTSTWTFILQPQGKVDAWARVTKTSADGYLFDTDPGFGDGLATRLSRFMIRTAAEVDATTERCIIVRGADAPRDDDLPEGTFRLAAVGPAVEGYDLVGASVSVPDGIIAGTADDYHAYRAVHGVPVMGRELGDTTIPAEIGQWIIDESVCFTKGCFVGQELVARIDSRGGNVPRRLRAITLDGSVEVGDAVDGSGPCGPVTTTGHHDDHGHVALAFCGRRVEPGDDVLVGGVPGTVNEVPLTPAVAS